VDECSAKADINIDETFQTLAETIRQVQMKLIEKGAQRIERLKLKDEETSM